MLLFFFYTLLIPSQYQKTNNRYAYVVDVSSPENRARDFGFLGAVFGAALAAGPFSAGIISEQVTCYTTRIFFEGEGEEEGEG